MTHLHEPLQFHAEVAHAPPRPGTVLLVGAGPGDPELLTVRAARALRRARLVLYDHLVSREVLRLVPEDADLLYVGKESGRHTLPQESITELMVRLARSGKSLLRLKGGDPYVFGRGGEEAEALAAAGVPFEVVPGISAAQGMAACAGMPLTHRDHAASVVFATGHLREGSRDGARDGAQRGGAGAACSVDLDWAALARPRQTVVIYMGVATLPVICAQLIAHGLPADTPAAVVERATLPEQRSLVGTLASLPALAQMHDARAPALIVVGSVVSLHGVLSREAAVALEHTEAR